MKLTIDNRSCDLIPGQRIELHYDADDLCNVQSGVKGFAVRLRLPASKDNHRAFGFPGDPNAASRFNATVHQAVLTVEGARILAGQAVLLSTEKEPSDKEEWLVEIRGGISEWAVKASNEQFSTLDIPFSKRLTPTSITESWSDENPVRFFPVHYDRYTPELSSTELIAVERILSVDDYHPFLSLAAVVRAIFEEAGYKLRSNFFSSDFFQKLYMSGAWPSRDTEALRRNMDFFARRKTSAASTANNTGRVYASPFRSINSVGSFVETVNPNDTDESGETLTDVFSNNHCLTMRGGEPVFIPMTSLTVGFEYHIRYITAHRILSRTRLKGFDSVYLGDGTDVRTTLANRHVDRRESLKPYFQYRAIVFDHVPGDSYRITCTRNGTAGTAIGVFDTRSALVTTPVSTSIGKPVLLRKAAGSSIYTVYTGDWALYDGYIGETGQTEVEMTLRTNPVTVTPSAPKTFSGIYFYGAEEGMGFSLSRACTLRPDFSSAPGLDSLVSFRDVSRHDIRKRVVLDALQHLFNLRIYTHEPSRTVYVEPADDFFRLGQEVDWTDKIDLSQPVVLSDIAHEAERERTYKFKAADGAVSRSDTTLGQWRLVNTSAAAEQTAKSIVNPLFAPTASEAGHYANAPSALIMQVGDRDAGEASGRREFTPRIVRYRGMKPLPESERWGFPADGNSYPFAAFCSDDFTLGFEDRNGHPGLHRYYDTRAEQELRCQHITLNLRLEPHEIENLFHIGDSAPSIASTFRLRIGGEEIRCTLRRIEAYDPSSPSTRCVFTRLP